jgi:hypothetical protein
MLRIAQNELLLIFGKKPLAIDHPTRITINGSTSLTLQSKGLTIKLDFASDRDAREVERSISDILSHAPTDPLVNNYRHDS